MKVLDLQCLHGHVFEGWFASEDEFQQQKARQLLSCPVCGEAQVVKLPSAPRLNLGAASTQAEPAQQGAQAPAPSVASVATSGQGAEAGAQAAALQAAWMHMVRHVVANTEDVGQRFAEEARRMHYGETPERGIRGQATRQEAEALQEEGIAVAALPLPPGFKHGLH